MGGLEKLRKRYHMNSYDNLIFAIEPQDTLSGAPYVNCSSKSYYVKEFGKLTPPLPYHPQEWIDGVRNGRTFSHRFKFGKYIEYTHINSSTPYVYYIHIENVYFFKENKDLGFKLLDNKVLDDCKNNKCLIVLSMAVEGTSGTPAHPDDFQIIETWVQESGIPGKNLIYFTGNHRCQELTQNFTYETVPTSVQEIWNNPFQFNDSILDYKPSIEKSLYLNLNRAPRYHRKLLLAYLIKHDLLKYGYNSWNINTETINELSNFDPSLDEAAKFLDLNRKQFVDVDNTNNLASNLNLSLYEKTFLSLVTETMHYPETIFFSEKTWKPIMVGHPFIILGSPGMLRILKNRGFMTFDKWFDESYDDALDLKTRIAIILDNIKKYSSIDILSLAKIREEMNEVCLHNKRRLKDIVRENFMIGDEAIYQKPILDYINQKIKQLTIKDYE